LKNSDSGAIFSNLWKNEDYGGSVLDPISYFDEYTKQV
jgi:hypothetical protein